MKAPTTSVVVCAYTVDRWAELSAALRAAAAQGPDQLLLVVDHNDQLYRRAETELTGPIAGLTVLANVHRRGLSGARNTAIAAATAEVVVFLDDDATPTAGWLDALRRPYQDPQVIAVGGAARPIWPTGQQRPVTLPSAARPNGPPAWGELDWVVGCSYAGLPTTEQGVRNLMGCNMSFRREVFTTVGGFSEELGRVGRTPLGCEETELCIRAVRSGRVDRPARRIVFVPDAQVEHHVSVDRLTWSYLLRRGWAEGISKAAVATLVGASDATTTERRYVARVLPQGVLRELGAVRTGGAAAALGALAIALVLAATTAGFLRGRLALLGQRRRGRDGGAVTDGDLGSKTVNQTRRKITSPR